MHESSRDSLDGKASGAHAEGGVREPLSAAESEFARELFERHRLALYRYLSGLLHSREEAREILQETYSRLLRQPSFDHVRQNARAYLFQTATNLARDFFRQRALKGPHAELTALAAGSLESQDWASGPEFALEAEQVAALIVSVLNELEQPVRTALLLHRFRDMTYGQIGRQLGVSERTIERYIKAGLDAIVSRLKVEL